MQIRGNSNEIRGKRKKGKEEGREVASRRGWRERTEPQALGKTSGLPHLLSIKHCTKAKLNPQHACHSKPKNSSTESFFCLCKTLKAKDLMTGR